MKMTFYPDRKKQAQEVIFLIKLLKVSHRPPNLNKTSVKYNSIWSLSRRVYYIDQFIIMHTTK